MIIRARKGRLGTTYQLDYGLVDGRRVQKNYKTREMAEQAMRLAKETRRSHGDAGLSPMTARDAADMMVARERLEGTGLTLQDAVDFVLRHARHLREKVLLPAAVERFLKSKELSGRSRRTMQTMRVSLPSLARSHPLMHVSDVTREDVERWLRGNAWAVRTQNNRLGEVRTFFNWAIREKLATTQPCEGMSKQRIAEAEIATLTFGECQRLLKVTRGTAFAAYVALGMFCGLRRAELERLQWVAVDLKERTVIVAGAQAKTRQRRVVDLSANAVAWLQVAKKEDGRISGDPLQKIAPGNFKDDWIEFRRAHGFAAWPHNALRHTFASYHYAMHQNEALLQAQMGHENAVMLHRHYRALKKKVEAVKFWKLKPGK